MATELEELEAVVSSPADKTRWKLLCDYLLSFVLRADRLKEVRMGETHVVLVYLNEQGLTCERELLLEQWLRLQAEDHIEPLDAILGAVPVVALAPVSARVPHIEVLPEPLPEPVAELVTEVVAEPEPVQNEFRFGVGTRVMSHKTGKHGSITRRDHYDCKVTYGVSWDGSMIGQANCPDAELLPIPTEKELAGERRYSCPEEALADGVGKPECWYYVRFSPSSMTTDPKHTAIEALLLNGLGDLLYVPSRMANDCNVYDVRDISLSYSVALAHFLGRMVGALVLYDANDELPEGLAYQTQKRFLDTILSGPEPLTLADINEVIQEYGQDVGNMTRSRCELLFRLLRQCEKFATNDHALRHRAQWLTPLLEGFSCDPATPTGYALRVSAYKAKPLFTPAESRLLKELLQRYMC
jgi:hypothetical protein